MPRVNYRKGSHTVYNLKCHIVWIAKYRKPVSRGDVGKQGREWVRQTRATLNVYMDRGYKISRDDFDPHSALY